MSTLNRRRFLVSTAGAAASAIFGCQPVSTTSDGKNPNNSYAVNGSSSNTIPTGAKLLEIQSRDGKEVFIHSSKEEFAVIVEDARYQFLSCTFQGESYSPTSRIPCTPWIISSLFEKVTISQEGITVPSALYHLLSIPPESQEKLIRSLETAKNNGDDIVTIPDLTILFQLMQGKEGEIDNPSEHTVDLTFAIPEN